MPDQRSVMKEFRFLDEKRSAVGLTPAEELRYAELRDLVAPELGAGGARRGFDVDAAAARLRESLLPAGLRNRPPPTPVAEPEPVVAEALSATDALSSAFDAQPFGVLDGSAQPEALFDPASLDAEPGAAAWDPNAQAYDPSQPYDPNAQAYDPSQPYDPNAQAYDPSQPYDPNAQAYDPSQPYDPNAQAYDPSQPFDPNAQAYDPSQPYDPNAQAYDPSQPYDPNAQAYDPSQPYDPNAQAYDPSQPWDTSAATCEASPPYDPGAHLQAGAPLEEEPAVEATSVEIDSAAATALDLDAPALAPVPPVHPFSADAGDLGGLPEDAGEELAAESAWEVAAGALDTDPPSETAAHDTAPGDELEMGAWSDAGAPSIEATAEQLAEGELAPLPEGEFLSDEEPEAPAFHSDASPLPPAGWDVEPPRPEPVSAEAFGDYDETGGTPAPPGEDAGLESMLPLDPALPVRASEDVREGFGDVLGEYDDTAGFAAPYSDPTPPDLMSEVSGFQAAQAVEPAERGGWDPDLALDAPPLDDGFRLESGGSFDAPAPTRTGAAGGTALWEIAAAEPPAAAAAGAPDRSALDADEFSVDVDDGAAPGQVATPADLALGEGEDEGDLPTIDGEDILEEIIEDIGEEVPEQPAVHVGEVAAVEPHLEATDSEPLDLTLPGSEEASPDVVAGSRIVGVHRVVVHTIEGLVRRGVLEDADLEAPNLPLLLQPGAAPEWLETETVKAIFFMLAAGERPPAPEGKRVRVTFADGRQVAGFSPDYREDRAGFFMIPADTRTNTGRIWVYRAAARQVTVS